MTMTLQQARTTVRTVSGLDVIVGLWLIVAPFALGYASVVNALWNDIIIGAAVVILAASREIGEGYKVAWPSWINVLLGLWLIFAPFALGYSSIQNAVWNDALFGIAIAILAGWSALSTPHEGVERT
ncbi:MAG: SPW repeat protein [Candidatus Binatia bacterium]